MRSIEVPSISELSQITKAVEEKAWPLRTKDDLKPLIDKLGLARIVMLGESSHGTQEFYEWRRLISQELIAHHGFQFIAVEGDWPACYQLNRFIRGEIVGTAKDALKKFRRWPVWMWSNTDIIELVHWLRYHNQQVTVPAGFFGLDVYSLFESIDEVIQQTAKIDPQLSSRLRERYGCFEPFQKNEKAYARSLLHFPEGCEEAVLQSLQEILERRIANIENSERIFNAIQNARIVSNAEQYYRVMVLGGEDSWNVRDQHMMETLETLLHRYGPHSKGIVWAHNTHIGDYRATDMMDQGQINIGGLAREKYGDREVQLVGFSTYQGGVTASTTWDGPILNMNVPPGIKGSYESVFHTVARRLRRDQFILPLYDKSDPILAKSLGHRAIGVVYNPLAEQYGNYVPTSLSGRYDAMIFLDNTHPLTVIPQNFDYREIPETWPQGL